MPAVYQSSYDLGADPFGLSPDARLSFGHPGYRRARAYMRYALRRAEGFAVLTGAPGTGKTTLVNDLLAQNVDARSKVISLPGARLGARDLRHLVATSLDACSEHSNQAALLWQIERALIRRQGKRQRVVLIVDEAHNLSVRVLEELRLLADLQHRGRLMLQVLLVGQEPLLELIRAPGMEHFRQRIIAAAHLEALSVAETADYIAYRLWRAGWHHGPDITPGAVASVHDFSAGIPRRINLISSRLLVLGAVERKRILDRDDVETLVAALKQEMRFEDPGLRPRPAAERDPGAPKRPSDQQNAAGVHPSVRSDKASEPPAAALSPEMFVAELDDRSGANLGITPRESQPARVASSSSCRPPYPSTKQAGPDTDLTAMRAYWNTDPQGNSASRTKDNRAPAALKDLSGYTGQAIHLLSGSRTKIGRHTSNADNTAGPGIALKCLCVSRSHALIERQDRSYWITDLGSVNGTYVNNERVAGQRCLRNGDTVRVARYEFEFTSASDLLRSA